MADNSPTTVSQSRSSTQMAETDNTPPSEETPLLTSSQEGQQEPPLHENNTTVYKVLFTSFLISLSVGVTQVPLIYVFGVMTCDEYYKTHPEPPPEFGNRCHVHEIEASTAAALALLAGSTTLFGVFNLFFTGWSMKAFGIKKALLLAIGFPAVRLMIQNVGVYFGGTLGIFIIQASQVITIVGGPSGYMLALNSFASEVVKPSERTATLGRVTGCVMFGMAFGLLAGGYVGDIFGIAMPFRLGLGLFIISFTYAVVALPEVKSPSSEGKNTKSLSAFFDPLKMFAPVKYKLRNGNVKKEYGVLLLGLGVFLGVLATSYIPLLLQMYSTDVFDFGTKENGWLISINAIIRGLFLTFAFPSLISGGRKWLDKKDKTEPTKDSAKDAASPEQPLERDTEDTQEETREPEETEYFLFDLWFTKYSLILDGLLTGLATFTTHGWQMYILSVVLPLAAGTGPAAKGTMLQLCAPEQRTDALSAIGLVELIAQLSSTLVFGSAFALFASIGRVNLIFTGNAAVALIGFIVLMLVRFPSPGSIRFIKPETTQT